MGRLKNQLEDELASLLGKPTMDQGGEIWIINVDEAGAQVFRQQMTRAARESSDPIVVYIDSYGGSVDAMAKMMETMDEVPNPKITVCMGKAMSAGAILLSHGDYRYCGQHSRVMIHEALGAAQGTVSQVNVTTDELNRINRYFNDILAKNCGLAGGYDALKKKLEDQGNGDWYMTAEEAVAFGIVDAVGVPILLHNVTGSFLAHKRPVKVRKRKRPDKDATRDLMRQLGLDAEDAKRKRTQKKTRKEPQ